MIGDHRKKNDFDSKQYLLSSSKKLRDKSMLSYQGPVFGQDKWRELSKFDILIQPSRSEGMPLTVIEAMSIGIPCIVSKETNMGEIINEAKCGWVINATVDDLFKTFNKIESFHKITLAKMGLNGMRYSKKKLNWNEVSKINYL